MSQPAVDVNEAKRPAAAASGHDGAGLPEPSRRPKIVIVGGGFGGMEAARALAEAPVEITLIDRQNHHCFQPLLYQVATAALSPGEVAWPIRGILHRQQNVRVVMASVTGIDLQGRRVLAGAHVFPYDHLVLATGARHSYFGHDEWAAFAPGLKQIEDATKIRRHILLAFEHAELAEHEAERRRLLTFVIIGGGPTGVEMAGAIAEVARETLRHDFREIDPRTARIVLIEAGPRVLPSFPEKLSDNAKRSLERLGVEVLTWTMVTGCDESGVQVGGHRIDADTLIWAAGVAASPAASWVGAAHDNAGRIKVAADLSVPGVPDVFAIGDTALVLDRSGKPVPGIAPAAKQMGRYVGGLIRAKIERRKPPRAFRYIHYGDLATVGRKSAVVVIKPYVQLTGLIGWLFWSVAHIYFLISVRNRLVVAISWFWSYVTFQRAVRLIVGP